MTMFGSVLKGFTGVKRDLFFCFVGVLLRASHFFGGTYLRLDQGHKAKRHCFSSRRVIRNPGIQRAASIPPRWRSSWIMRDCAGKDALLAGGWSRG